MASDVDRTIFFPTGLPASVRTWWLGCVLAAVGLLFSQSGLAQVVHNAPPMVELGVWMDASGQATLQDAQQQSFKVAPDILGLGYTSSATWWRVRIAAHPESKWLLTVQPTYLDNVRLYTQASSGQWQLQQSGDRYAFQARDRKELYPSFALELQPHVPTVAYVRIQTTSSHISQLRLRRPDTVADHDVLLWLVLGVYVGVALLLACSSMLHFLVSRDPMWLATSSFQLVGALSALTGLGVHHKYGWPDHPALADAIFSASITLHLALGNVFSWLLFRTYAAPVWVTRLFLLAIGVLPFQWLAIATDHTRWAMALNANLLLACTILSFVVVWRWINVPHVEVRHPVQLTYTVYMVYLSFHILPVLGVGSLTVIHLYPALFSNLFSALMLHLIQLRRERLQHQERQTLGAQVKLTQQQLLWEQRRYSEATGFLGMLLHELKTPLASIRLAVMMLGSRRQTSEQAQAQRMETISLSVAQMDAVLERCRQVDRLEQGDWTVQSQPEDVSALIGQWVQELSPLQSQRIRLTSPSQLIADAEAALLRTMVMNLLDNALTYSPISSTVVVDLMYRDAPSPHWTLTVCNHIGKAGVPDPAKVFGKYYRAEAAHQHTGSGLGLFLVKNLASLTGGDLLHRNEPDQVVFELWQPLKT